MRILVAIADVDALVKKGSAIDEHARANTTSVYTAAAIFPMLPEQLSTDLTSLSEGQERLAIVIEMTVARDGAVTASDVYRALVRNHAKLAYNGVAAWLEGTAPAPAEGGRGAGLDEQLRLQDRVAQAMKALRHEHGALSLETIEARAVFDGDALADLRPDEKNRAKELIEDFMIARQRRDGAVSRSEGPSRRCGACCARPSAGSGSSSWPRASARRCPATPSAQALEAFLAARRKADPLRFPDLSLSVIKLLGRGEYVVERPGRAGGRTLRARGEGLHALDGAEPALSRSDHAAAAQGGAGGPARRPTPTRSWTPSPSTARRRRTTPPRSSGRCASRRRRCSCRRGSASASTPS